MIYQLLNFYKNVVTIACNGPPDTAFLHCSFWDFPLDFKWWNFSFTTSNLCIPFFNLKGILGWDSHHRRENHQGISTFWTPCASCDLQVKRMAEDLIWFPVLHPEVQNDAKWWEACWSYGGCEWDLKVWLGTLYRNGFFWIEMVDFTGQIEPDKRFSAISYFPFFMAHDFHGMFLCIYIYIFIEET